MIHSEWRLDMQLKDARMLRQYMDFKGMTIRELAHRAGVSRSTIGHLVSGARRTCSPKTARVVEEALDAPSGLLFEGRSSKVQCEVASLAKAG